VKKLTPELKELLDKNIEFASMKEVFIFALWDIFCPQKRDKVIEGLKNGKMWKFAFNDIKNNQNIVLNKKDSNIFFNEINNPSKPNKALKNAALQYKNKIKI
jgi:hypothetical protein